MIDNFQNGNVSPIMIISLKAGGTGLNLTAATNVIHYDLWWNPAVEAQATDRTYRIGQSRKVIVHRLITISTFEEKIDEMISAKKELAELTVSTGEK
jgi:SNF2 family DNA or RNA helicase